MLFQEYATEDCLEFWIVRKYMEILELENIKNVDDLFFGVLSLIKYNFGTMILTDNLSRYFTWRFDNLV